MRRPPVEVAHDVACTPVWGVPVDAPHKGTSAFHRVFGFIQYLWRSDVNTPHGPRLSALFHME